MSEQRLIDANKIPWCNYDLDNYLFFVGVDKEYVDEMPTIDAEPVRHGRWIIKKRHTVSRNPYMDDNYYASATCSECDFCIHAENASFGYPKLNTTNYCPNCGADMRERRDNDGIV